MSETKGEDRMAGTEFAKGDTVWVRGRAESRSVLGMLEVCCGGGVGGGGTYLWVLPAWVHPASALPDAATREAVRDAIEACAYVSGARGISPHEAARYRDAAATLRAWLDATEGANDG